MAISLQHTTNNGNGKKNETMREAINTAARNERSKQQHEE
jgi:hypothetical protein